MGGVADIKHEAEDISKLKWRTYLGSHPYYLLVQSE
jgi:hypothetical protein